MVTSRAIIGGGNGSIAQAIIQEFVQLEYEVHGIDISDTITESAKALGATGHICDLTDEISVSQLPEFDGVDVLVNAAGIWPRSAFEDVSLNEWNNVINTNLTSAFLTTKHFLKALKQKRGVIVNITSAAALKGNPKMAAYAAAKAGLIGLTRVIARELGVDGIRVNAVAPGLVDMPYNRTVIDQEGWDKARSERCIAEDELPADVARVVKFLAQADSKMITGQTIVVDGGVAFL